MLTDSSFLIAVNEKERSEALKDYQINCILQEPEFDNITLLASYLCNAPITCISFFNENRIYPKSIFGVHDLKEFDGGEMFLQYTIMGTDILEVSDTLEHPIFKENNQVKSGRKIRSYTGIPIKNPDEKSIGALGVWNFIPGKLPENQIKGLKILAMQIIEHLKLNAVNRNLNVEIAKLSPKKQDSLSPELESYRLPLDETQSIMVFEKSGIVTYVNDSINEVSRYSKEDLLGSNMREMEFRYQPKEIIDEIWSTICVGNIWRGEIKSSKKDGTTYRVDSTIFPLLDAKKNPIQFIEIRSDLTEKEKFVTELIEAKNIAEKAAYAKDTFLTNMSHEIRTPMNSIVGFSELLSKTQLDEKQTKYMNNIQSAGQSLLSVINDVLDLSKIESGEITLEQAPFDLKKTLKFVYDSFKLTADEKNLEFNLFLDVDIPQNAVGDSGKLIQILNNLTRNAIKFTEKGNVTLSTKLLEETDNDFTLKISARDTGIGIPQDKLQSIYDSFVQADASMNRKHAGAGVGLNIVKHLIELKKGTIEVHSEEGKGTEFVVILPFKKETPQDQETNGAAIPEGVNGPNSQYNILLCEDNPLNQFLVQNIMEEFDFYLSTANNGKEGIALLQQNEYDLVLMDLQMPIMDGYQAVAEIRNKLQSDIPIIAMTAHSMIGEKEKCLALGMNGYLAKPFKQDELLALINEHARKKRTTEYIVPENNIDFSYLDELSGGNSDFKNSMIGLFLENIPADLEKLEVAIEGKDYPLVKSIAHHMKSTVMMFKLDDIMTNLGLIESQSLNTDCEIKDTFTTIKKELTSALQLLKNIYIKTT